jgi:PAS domain S-box-containing protein
VPASAGSTPDLARTTQSGAVDSSSHDSKAAPATLDHFIGELTDGDHHRTGADPVTHALCVLGRFLSTAQAVIVQPAGEFEAAFEIIARCNTKSGVIQNALPHLIPVIADSCHPGGRAEWNLKAPAPGNLAASLRAIHAHSGASALLIQRLPRSAASPPALLVVLLCAGPRDQAATITLVRVAALHLAGQLDGRQHALARKDADRRWREAAHAGLTSESRFREVLEHTADAVFFLRVEAGPRFIYERINPRFTRFTGIPVEKTIGRTATELFPAAAAAHFERDCLDCIHLGNALTRDQHVALAQGAFFFRTTLIPIHEADGAITHLIGFSTDLTDLHQQQTLLAESESVARTGGWDFDCITHTLRWTPGTHLIFETDPATYQPSLASTVGFYAEDCRIAVEFALKNALQTGANFDFIATARTTSGRPINLRSIGQIEEVDGHVVRILGAIVDITAQEQAEEERLRLEAQLRRAQKMEAIGTLAGGIAHDFNNILAGIMGNVQLAANDLIEGSSPHRFLDRAFASCIRASDLVRRMLTFSRQVEQPHVTTAVQPLVDEAIALLRASLPANVAIARTGHEEPLAVIGDPGQIHQVLLNLATNAVQAMNPDGGTLIFEVAPSPPDDIWHHRHPQVDLTHSIRLSVTDTGAGMGQETVERIFEPFFTTKPFGEGSGLGLAVVHGIMETHGGAIVVESTLGKGSSFHLFFASPIRSTPAVTIAPQTARAAVAVGRGQHILVVDDEPTIRSLAGSVLQHLGYRATIFHSPSEAIERFCANPGDFDCLLTDFSMPGMNGLDLAAALTAIRPELPVVIMTGFLRAHELTPLRDSGVHHLINKPFTIEALAAKFSDLFRATATIP